MPKPNNAYIAKQKEKQRQHDMIVMLWSRQVAFDSIMMVLNDPAIMGKDVFGKQRLRKVCNEINKKMDQVTMGITSEVDSSHVRAQVDRELQRICGEEFAPWEERYEYWDDRGI